MKKSQLIKIIKEEITKVISEQSSQMGFDSRDRDQVDFVAEVLISYAVNSGGRFKTKEDFVKAHITSSTGLLNRWFSLLKQKSASGKRFREIFNIMDQDSREASTLAYEYGVGGIVKKEGIDAALNHIDKVAAAILNKATDGDPRLGGTAISRGLTRRAGS
jgi:predicted RNase H-related nuclease YkuK (DUF458 family)